MRSKCLTIDGLLVFFSEVYKYPPCSHHHYYWLSHVLALVVYTCKEVWIEPYSSVNDAYEIRDLRNWQSTDKLQTLHDFAHLKGGLWEPTPWPEWSLRVSLELYLLILHITIPNICWAYSTVRWSSTIHHASWAVADYRTGRSSGCDLNSTLSFLGTRWIVPVIWKQFFIAFSMSYQLAELKSFPTSGVASNLTRRQWRLCVSASPTACTISLIAKIVDRPALKSYCSGEKSPVVRWRCLEVAFGA